MDINTLKYIIILKVTINIYMHSIINTIYIKIVLIFGILKSLVFLINKPNF